MQPYPLVQTKLYTPPVRPELVPRPRLVERLNAGLRRPDGTLTLVSAPAGFGKTTLVSEWVHETGADAGGPQVAWLSLDEDDNDLARFLVYVVTALSKIEPKIGKGVLNQLRTTPPPVEEIVTFLINVMTTGSHQIILVLDDYHLIEDQAIHDTLAFLLARMPQQLYLVICTREDPYLPLARMRARGQLIELRATDLRFSASEAAEFLNRVMGLGLSPEDIVALESRTEGWIAGLQLAALSMQGRQDVHGFIQSFTGSHRFVLDYLVEEVLEHQPEEVQAFLLQTAILDRLTGPLCDAVRSGGARAPSQTILDRLDRANLFIVPLDSDRRWYRYHHLFADLLRQRLKQTGAEQIPALHRRASEWHEQNDLADEAIAHALWAGDLERAASMVEAQADAAWRRGEHAKLRSWLDALPPEMSL
ncbi:MAG: LuxR family transcriptional regulator, partial [Anaerolineae bacterium]